MLYKEQFKRINLLVINQYKYNYEDILGTQYLI